MPFKVRPVYASAAPGKKPTKFEVIDDRDGSVVDTHIHKESAQAEAKRRNAAFRSKFRTI